MNKFAAYQTGKAAEDQVARLYAGEGYLILARRWRGPAGELDLVVERDGEIVFVEVKAARDFARAVASLTGRQIERIYASAAHFLSFVPLGQNTPSRFDVALVDRMGRIDRVEKAIGM
ncbi:MAG: YraN family protein [Pseudomonadota bacterium]